MGIQFSSVKWNMKDRFEPPCISLYNRKANASERLMSLCLIRGLFEDLAMFYRGGFRGAFNEVTMILRGDILSGDIVLLIVVKL